MHHIASIIVSPTTYVKIGCRGTQVDHLRELARQIHSVLYTLLAFHTPSRPPEAPPEDSHESCNNDAVELADKKQEEVDQPYISYRSRIPVILPQLLVAGEVSPAQDLKWFLQNSPNQLIATPGRLHVLVSATHVHWTQSSFEALVLDEADRLLDMGFKDDLQKIIQRLPKQRRTGLFSATVSEAVDQIVRVGLRNPVKIAVKVKSLDGAEDKNTPARYGFLCRRGGRADFGSLQMCHMIQPASQKLPAIHQILSTLSPKPLKTIIYLSTCAAVDYFQHVLPHILPKRDGESFNLIPLHGKQQQKIRQKNFTRFADSTQPAVLLTTDVAARGVDIPQVDLVLQIDPPNDPKVFLHRCGRAGRAGRKGLSIIFLQPGREEDYLPFLEIRKTPLSLYSTSGVSGDDARKMIARIRQVVLTDRALHEKAQRAFVSWAKAYSKHQASSIFRLVDQDWEDLGNAWGLLKLPKMPELRSLTGNKSLGNVIDWQAFAYKDKAREAARQKEMAAKDGLSDQNAAIAHSKPIKRAWSQKHEQQEDRLARRAKRQKKSERKRWDNMAPEEREKAKQLEGMIERVRRMNEVDSFEGFDD